MSAETPLNASGVPEAIQKKADAFFKANPAEKMIVATADGYLFRNPKFAADHAATLDEAKRNVLVIKNTLVIEVQPEAPQLKVVLTDAQKELLKNGLESKNYNDMKALVKELELSPENGKAESLIKVLEDFKTANNL